MLALTRKAGESVMLILPDGRPGRITVRPYKGGKQTQMLFELPRDVQILRTELVESGRTEPTAGDLRQDA